MERGKLGSYDLMVISKYFNTIDDFVNMELASPKARGNMEKFHFNPIALDQWSRKFFTSLETLHLYTKKDDTFPEETFYRKIIHYEVTYEEWKQNKKDNSIYKHIKLLEEEACELDTIPEGITEIEERCFRWRNGMKELVIPNSVTSIGPRLLEGSKQLTSLTIPTHWSQVGNRIFNNRPFFCSFRIPENVKTINGKEVVIEEVKEFDIPMYVTKLTNWCFRGCNFTKITIPPSVVEIGGCFWEMTSLKSIEIPTSVTKFDNSLFSDCSSLTSITLHDNYKEVQYKDFFNCTSLSSIVLPSTVTHIGYGGFASCSSLTSINFSRVRQFGYGCFCESGMTRKDFPHLPAQCFKW